MNDAPPLRSATLETDPEIHARPLGCLVWLVELRGDCDLVCTPDLVAALRRGVRTGYRRLIVDMSEASFVDCTTVGALVRELDPLRNDPSAAVVIAGAGGPVRRLLDLLPVGDVFARARSREAAYEDLRSGRSGLHAGWRAVSAALHEQALRSLEPRIPAARTAPRLPRARTRP